MATSLRVSVVIPAYNAAAFIDDALAGVVAQTRPAHEVIVVDDGSTDETSARVRAWEGRTGSTRLILLGGPNRGLSTSRNRGILTASGELVALLDSDDYFLPRHLELLVPAFERAPDVVLAFSDMMRFAHGGEDRGSVLGALREELAPISTPLGDDGMQLAGTALRRLYLMRAAIAPSVCIVSREAVAGSGLFDTTLPYGEDLDFLWRLLGAGRGAWLNQVTGRKRDHGSNASAPARAEWSERHLLRTIAQLLRFGVGHTPDEVAALERHLTLTLGETGWIASGKGWQAYRAWRAEVLEWTGRAAPRPHRHLLRLLRRSLAGN
ncbi:MAG: glycosyltransferase [Gemmatimonadales bacterium]|nr:glycosyltransferase [Gemmatimonadales bacterium]